MTEYVNRRAIVFNTIDGSLWINIRDTIRILSDLIFHLKHVINGTQKQGL